MPFHNFQQLKACIPIEDAARALKLKLRPQQDHFHADCPVCGAHEGLKITPVKGFYCHGRCDASGSVIDLVMHIKGFKKLGEAAEWLANEFGTDTVPDRTVQNSTVRKDRANEPQNERRAEPTAPKEFDFNAAVAKLKYVHELADAGLPEDIAKEVGIGFMQAAGSMRNHYCFVLRRPDGSEVCLMGLDPAGLPYLKFPSKFLPAKVVPLRRPA